MKAAHAAEGKRDAAAGKAKKGGLLLRTAALTPLHVGIARGWKMPGRIVFGAEAA